MRTQSQFETKVSSLNGVYFQSLFSHSRFSSLFLGVLLFQKKIHFSCFFSLILEVEPQRIIVFSFVSASLCCTAMSRTGVARGALPPNQPVALSSTGEQPWTRLRVLKNGCRAEIILAFNHRRELIVVKVYKEQFSTTPTKPVREYQMLKATNHPNVVKIVSFGRVSLREGVPFVNNRFCIPMELMDMGSVREFVDRLHSRSFPVAQQSDAPDETQKSISESSLSQFALAIAVQALAGLQEIHAKGNLHRDVKPDNILISSCGRAKWCDFDCGFEATIAGSDPETLNVGTEGYVAPEIVTSVGDAYTTKSDLWSLGVTLYWIAKRTIPEELRNFIRLEQRRRDNPSFRTEDVFQLDTLQDACLRSLLQDHLLVSDPAARSDAFLALRADCLREWYDHDFKCDVVTELRDRFGLPIGCELEELRRMHAILAGGEFSEEAKRVTVGLFKRLVLTRQGPAVRFMERFFQLWSSPQDTIQEATASSTTPSSSTTQKDEQCSP